MRIVVSGGGTGGHIYPALAFIKEVKRHHEDVEFLYIGTEKGLEKNIVEREGSLSRRLKLRVLKESCHLKTSKPSCVF